jgi:hypothetical protein
MAKVIVFLGRSVEGIIRDVEATFPVEPEDILVVAQDNEKLTPPQGYPCVTVSAFTPDPTEKYILIANGGRTAQSFPVVKKLVRVFGPDGFEAHDLQPEGCTQVW